MTGAVEANKPYGFSVFCDGIREEVGGKHTLVGVYGDVMFVDIKEPIAIPSFGVVFHLLCHPSEQPKSLELQIFLPGQGKGDKPFFHAEVPVDQFRSGVEGVDEGKDVELLESPRSHVVIKANISPLPLETYGRIRTRAIWNGEIVPLGSLLIAQNPKKQ